MLTKCAPVPIVAAITLWQLMHLGKTGSKIVMIVKFNKKNK